MTLTLSAGSGRGAGGAVAVCTLVNPSYSGSCVVREAIPEGGTAAAVCGKVLKCLNDTACSSKTYCDATEVRGGWVLEKAEEQPKKSAS
jgi:hypothetical protein